tara:strand:+ start:488 stop:1036 length:549 start_codon:yes stop_codon:yes gene_type:complete
MPTCNILGHGVIHDTYEDQGFHDMCRWQQPTVTYEQFLTGVTETYNNSSLVDRVYSDYVTQLYRDNFIVDTFVSAGTLNASTGVVTFTNTTGGTVAVSGFDGFTSYWLPRGGTNHIYNSGTTTSFVGIGTNGPTNQLHVAGSENPVKIEGLVEGENKYVTINDEGILGVSANVSNIVNGGTF